jgi:pimeloyl-ACP methyl ester carboxylesterase
MNLLVKREQNIDILTSRSNVVLIDLHYPLNAKTNKAIIFSHGYKSFKNWGAFDLIGDYFASKGYLFLKFNYSHNGTLLHEPAKILDAEKFGQNTIEIELDDLQSVIDYVTADPDLECLESLTELNIIGHSRGGSNAILAAARHQKISKLVTWAAFNDYENTWSRFYDMDEWQDKGVNYRPNKLTGEDLPLYYSLYENYKQHEEEYKIRKAVELLTIPFLAIHGIDDEYIPYEEALEMKKWNKKTEVSLLPYTSHLFGMYHPYKKNTLAADMQIVCDETLRFFSNENA